MKTLGVCGGNGVILHPFKNHLEGNLEIRPIFHTKGDKQWNANFSGIPLYKSKDEFFKPSILRNFWNTFVIIGAPDCGHSSILAYSRAKKLSNPKNNESLNLYIKAVKTIKPKVFLMENLPKLLNLFTETDFREVFSDYDLIFEELSVSKFGNSQKNRVRLIIIGIRKSFIEQVKNKLFHNVQYHFSNIYKVSKLKTSGELLRGLDKEHINIGNIRENINDIITIYAGKKLSLQDIRNYWERNPGEKRYLVTDRKFSTAPGVYRNLYDDFPATARKANRQYNHRGLQLTPRELARIQGVPDRFKIYMEKENLYYWINKGRATICKCPPYEVGYWFYKQCKKIRV